MDGFWLLLLEAGVALGLLIFIVWWTWPRGEPSDGRGGDTTPHRQEKRNDN